MATGHKFHIVLLKGKPPKVILGDLLEAKTKRGETSLRFGQHVELTSTDITHNPSQTIYRNEKTVVVKDYSYENLAKIIKRISIPKKKK